MHGTNIKISGELFSHISLVCSFQYFEVESDNHLFVGGEFHLFVKEYLEKYAVTDCSYTLFTFTVQLPNTCFIKILYMKCPYEMP